MSHGTQDLPVHTAAEAERVLLDAARRLTHPAYGGSSPICALSPTPRVVGDELGEVPQQVGWPIGPRDVNG